MKRLIAAVSLSVLVMPAFAASEERDDRAEAFFEGRTPHVSERSSSHGSERSASNVVSHERVALPAASAGTTLPDRQSAIDESFKSPWATGPWANDHHFIAPPQ